MKSILKNIVVTVLTLEAKLALKRHAPKIVAVTGNVGKTSTKDAIYAVLREAYGENKVRKSYKSLNSEIGLPLTILGLENAWGSAVGWFKNIATGLSVILFKKKNNSFPEWLVLEIGADHPGDIKSVSKWLRPDIVVLTRMSDVPVHVEFFKNTDEVLREKMYLAEALKSDGVLVVNADDTYFAEPVKALPQKKMFYGATKGSDVQILESETMYDTSPLAQPIGQYALVRVGNLEVRVEFEGVLGSHLMYPSAAACAVARVLGIESKIPSAFSHFESPRGRMRILKGRESSVIIDDSYNASPLATAAALQALSTLSVRGRKIAALADMKELGDNAEKAHRDIGVLAAHTLHTLVVVGPLAQYIEKGARSAGMSADRILPFNNSTDAAEALARMARAGDAILVKGSQSMRMERVSKALLAEPGKAEELLVRQEEEWQKR